MRSMSVKLLMVGLVAIIATSCAVTEEKSGPGADGVPILSTACVPDNSDCEDTFVVDDTPTGGPTPTAPDDGASSGFVIGTGLTISEAVAYDGSEPVAVGGYVVTTSEGTLLCEALAESFPPQCGGERITVTNPETLTGFVLVEEGNTQWSPEIVVVIGNVDGVAFTVAANVNG
jgi:hypothetical protein